MEERAESVLQTERLALFHLLFSGFVVSKAGSTGNLSELNLRSE